MEAFKIPELIAEAKRRKYEVTEDSDEYGQKLYGFRKEKKSVWHWFLKMDSCLYFDHSYSMNTGKTHKGTMHGLRIKDSIGFYKVAGLK